MSPRDPSTLQGNISTEGYTHKNQKSLSKIPSNHESEILNFPNSGEVLVKGESNKDEDSTYAEVDKPEIAAIRESDIILVMDNPVESINDELTEQNASLDHNNGKIYEQNVQSSSSDPGIADASSDEEFEFNMPIPTESCVYAEVDFEQKAKEQRTRELYAAVDRKSLRRQEKEIPFIGNVAPLYEGNYRIIPGKPYLYIAVVNVLLLFIQGRNVKKENLEFDKLVILIDSDKG